MMISRFTLPGGIGVLAAHSASRGQRIVITESRRSETPAVLSPNDTSAPWFPQGSLPLRRHRNSVLNDSARDELISKHRSGIILGERS